MLAGLYAQGGADAIREALKGQAPDEVIGAMIAQVAQAAAGTGAPSATSALPDETTNWLAGNTVAVKTQMREKLDEWRQQLGEIRVDFAGRGDDWAIEVAFADALLAVLADQPAVLPDDNPYQLYLRQVIEAIDQFNQEQKS